MMDPSRIRSFSMLFLIGFAAVWIASHGYEGLVHDSQLYAVQALNVISPETFKNDLFFAFGSQGQFTLFPRLYAFFIEKLEIDLASRLLLMIGSVLWAAAFLALARRLTTRFGSAVFSLLAVGGTRFYAGATFAYAEHFLTPRIFAEAGVLLALNLTVAGRTLLAWVAVFLILPIHPLVSLTGMVYLGLFLLLNDKRWVVLPILAVVAVAGIGLLGRGLPFPVFTVVDAEWFRIVSKVCPYLFVTLWKMADWSRLVFDLLLLVVGIRLSKGKVRMLLSAVLVAGAFGVAVNLLLGDFLRSTLVIQLQGSRLLWMAHLFSYLGVALALEHCFRNSGDFFEWVRLLWLVACGLSLQLLGSPLIVLFTAAVVLTPGFLGVVAERDRLSLVTLILPSVAVLYWGVRLVQDSSAEVKIQLANDPTFSANRLFFQNLGPALVLVAVLAALLLFVINKRRVSIAFGLAVLALVGSIWAWDLRSDQTLIRERDLFSKGLSPAPSSISEGSTVYWGDRHTLDLWFAWRRASYVSWIQRAGVIFFRGTAIEWERRMTRVLNAVPGSDYQSNTEGRALPEVRGDSAESLALLCEDPALDFVVTLAERPNSTPFEYLGQRYFLNPCR